MSVLRQNFYRVGNPLLLAVVMGSSAFGQPFTPAVGGDNPWTKVDQLPGDRPATDVWIRAQKFQAVELNPSALRRLLDAAPNELSQRPDQSPAQIALPMPDGSVARFQFVESPVMAPELAAKFPEIKTYLGQGMDDPHATVRFDLTPAGFHAQILSPRGAVYIDPAFRGDNRLHTSYFKRDYRRVADGFQCLTPGGQSISGLGAARPLNLARSGGNLRTYRLAVAATGEYTTYHGGTKSAGLAAVVTAVNRVTGVYESEMAIRLVLVANNDLVIYTSSGTDPFSNNSPSSLLTQNQSTLDSVIGSANYDIGHVFSTAGGGLSSLGVVCIGGQKARSETGTSAPTGDAFYIDYVAHEMGHEFGANHPFNGSTGACAGGNRNASTAYEPGSGSTIMAYAGICGSDDLQPHSDPYFHSISFDEILNYTTLDSGNNCAVISSTGNSAPTVSAGPNYTIPQNTPFTLTASGSDPNGDPLTYCWEERDLGPSTTLTAPDNGSSPLFRSFTPTTSPSRTFPRLQNLLNNTSALGEIMPTTTRTLNFRVTARDNRAGGGGVNTADMHVSVTSAAGPFLVTSHNSGGTFSGPQTVTWNVAGTTNAPVSAANVNIRLSTNGGLNFPITLLANAPNDGSQSVVLPNLTTTAARIKVEAAGNIFFDVCNANFSIVPGIPTPVISLESVTLIAENCPAANGAIDPGETVTLNFALKNTGSNNTTNLVATLLVTNGVTLPDGPQNYGALIAGGAPASQVFSLTATGVCGGTVTAVLQLQDGQANLGTVSQSFVLGTFTTSTISLTNAAAITIPASGTRGKASIYPSPISVAGMTGVVSKITVTLSGLNHTYPDDLDILLVGPTGQEVMLMSDAGLGNDLNNVVLTFDDDAINSLPDSSQILSGDYKPTNFDTSTDAMPTPAPAGPFGATLAAFNGLNPNGTWSLYINDDLNTDVGSLAQGWQLSITTSSSACCQSNALASDLSLHEFVSPAGLNVGSNLTLTLTVTNLGPDTTSSVTVTDALPAGVSFVSADATQGSYTNDGGVITYALGSLINNAFASITIHATATVAGSWTNTASVASTTPDPINGNNTATAVYSVNAFPTITHTENVTTNEDRVVGPLNFTIGDVETTAASLSLAADSSDTNLVPAASVVFGGSGSNRTVTIAPATNQFGAATITISVSDGQATASDSFVVTFTAVNHPPVLSAITNFTIVEGATVTFTNLATDLETPPARLTFSLMNAPTNATIGATNGVFTWTTSQLDGPGTNLISVIVTDDGVPSLSATQSFSVFVLKTNTAPELTAISDRKIHAGMTLVITNVATDPDVPPNALTFSLGAGSPATASIGATDGVFSWTPADADAGTVQGVTVRVGDDGLPPLSDAKTFLVTVVSRPLITFIEVTNNLVNLTWTSLAGQTYRLQYNTNLEETNWSDVLPDLVATSPSSTQTNAFVPEASRFYRVMIVP